MELLGRGALLLALLLALRLALHLRRHLQQLVVLDRVDAFGGQCPAAGRCVAVTNAGRKPRSAFDVPELDDDTPGNTEATSVLDRKESLFDPRRYVGFQVACFGFLLACLFFGAGAWFLRKSRLEVCEKEDRGEEPRQQANHEMHVIYNPSHSI